MPEPWLQADCQFLVDNTQTISAQDFRNYLKTQYQNLPKHLKDMMSFDYFEQQSEVKRPQIEQALIAQKRQSDGLKEFSAAGLNNWRILSMFEHWQDILLWQTCAASGQGMVLEFGMTESGFKSSSYNQYAQHCSAIKQVESWLPTDDLYYLFNRPQSGSSNHHEWRLIRKLEAADRKIEVKGATRAMFRLPAKAVKRVILGYRCSPEYCVQVKRYLSQDINYRHAECVQAQLNPKTLCLQLVAIQ